MNELINLRNKVKIIAFLELLFKVDKDERSLPFSRIAEVCRVDIPQVELLVMRAMSLNLVRGLIDQVDEFVHVDWIQPRYLSMDHIKIMVGKLQSWEEKMASVVKHVEDNANELINA